MALLVEMEPLQNFYRDSTASWHGTLSPLLIRWLLFKLFLYMGQSASTGSELRLKLEATKKIDQGLILKLRASTLECRMRLWKIQYGGSNMPAGSRRKIECPEEKACKNKNLQAIVSFFGLNCSWWTPLKNWCGRLTKSLMTDPIWRSKIQFGSRILENQFAPNLVYGGCWSRIRSRICKSQDSESKMADVFFENLLIGTKFDILGFLGVANYESEDRFSESKISNPI